MAIWDSAQGGQHEHTDLPMVDAIQAGRTAAAIVAVVLASALPARAEEDGARKVLKAMSDYMASQANLSFKFDSDLEVITPDLQKIQFSASGDVLLSRPDKIRITRAGGYADVELAFDGKMVSVVGKGASVVAQLDVSGTVDTLVDRLRNEFLIEIPGADLLLTNVYGQLIEGVIDAKHVGRGVVEGVDASIGLPQRRHRLAALGRGGGSADPPQIRHHQQDRRCRPAIHVADEGLENRCEARSERVRAEAAGRKP